MTRRAQQVPLVCHGHSRPIVEVSYSPVTEDGYFLMSASKDGKPMIRDGESGDWIGTFEGHKGAVWTASLNQPATHALTGSADFSARVWNAITGDELYSFQHKHIVRTAQFSKDSHHILTGGMEKKLRIYNLSRPDADPEVIDNLSSAIRSALWFQNDTLLLSSHSDKAGISIWDKRTLSLVRELETPAPVTCMELSQDGRWMTACAGRDILFWETAKMEVVKTHTMEFSIESASLHPNADKFVAGGEDMWVRLHDFRTGEELECNKGHHGPVHCVQFAPDGVSYASGSEDGTIRIWSTITATEQEDVTDSAKQLENLTVETNGMEQPISST
mmetsp:Transcript_39206/g.54429  ORF Transcript_39206/g.54429 Transcript_39206/m.54429 type:complete len:332 (+) Transcript_39206:402-1397(+)|eukprot:CAMPEP_0196594154 /NCGR_PEP_ID=MMETSP1081-20130531/77486_1 /TAXON_ID=36882 /ORGANISM="Pyramimonas amylifera, Strain CCMP720" /LENGTH=331 /DNA_ID=CAMNT_0041918331 /DNA_START=358 /DNA_END=1356 /DNA_ORIENTATION=-